MNVERSGKRLWLALLIGTLRRGRQKHECVNCLMMVWKKKTQGRITSRNDLDMKNTLFFSNCLVACQLNASFTEDNNLQHNITYHEREYTQSKRMLVLLTVFLFITAWIPQKYFMLNVIYSSILYICFYATIGLLVIWIFFLLFVICSIYIQMKHSGFNSDVKCMEVRGLNGYLQYITKKKKKGNCYFRGQKQKFNRARRYCMSPFIKQGKSNSNSQITT